ncbi:MAG TPA: CPBP family glutamic-type intramembrane protease [Planctomycetota bacterium]|nr:CPBP family glutamic-type intramembrane protease [Planctomycetota bacterium]
MTARAAAGGSRLRTYLEETREIGLSLVLVLPLLLAYEISMLLLEAPVRNGAELAVARFVGRLSPPSLVLLRRGLVLLLLVLALVMIRRHPPRVARARLVLLEALLFALALGPAVGWLLGGIGLSASAPASGAAAPTWLPFLLSVGAGLWEELVFRLALLGGLTLLLSRALGAAPVVAVAVAVLVSSLLFALYHHVGADGEPLTASRFLFRGIAGTILGLLFVFRGLAVVVYMHVFYDLLCDLRSLHG